LHFLGEDLISSNGNILDSTLDLKTKPNITEEKAIQYALEFIDAEKYMWETGSEEERLKKKKDDNSATYYPKAELVLCPDILNLSEEYKLAFKFEIYAMNPFSRDHVYVDALNGSVICINPIMVSVAGTAATRYSGTRTIETDQSGSVFVLHDNSRGGGIETYDLNNSTTLSSAVDFEDNDNNWTAAEHNNTAMDNAALDVHWAIMMTYDYFNSIHGRNSFDNSGTLIESYVHRGTNWVNARWTGTEMLFGDGDGVNFDPLTAVDVSAHEFGHAVCTHTANLAYRNESGAINEGLSDIWGACVENFAGPTKDIWSCGEEFDLRTGHSGARSMSNPNLEGQPDTYQGANWVTVAGCTPTSSNDFCGVHTNSGVMNYWFFLLSDGGTGTNDNGDVFNVTGIGIENAADILYRAESVYMTANTTFADARNNAIQSAEDLFGACSQAVESVTNAWYAVGVGNIYNATTTLANTNITTNTTIIDCSIEVENVTIESGSKLILDYNDNIIINGPFEAELGSELEIK
jgi:Zn-dependent metalloprotease